MKQYITPQTTTAPTFADVANVLKAYTLAKVAKMSAVVRVPVIAQKLAHIAKVATLKAVGVATLALGLIISVCVLFGSAFAFDALCEAVGVVFPGVWGAVVNVVFLFTIAIDLGCWASMQIMLIAEKCHAFAGFGGIYYRGAANGLFVRPVSIIGVIIRNARGN